MPIDFEASLNPAQLEAATTMEGPILVIAGAGSGKTRTIVYRLAYMVQQAVPPQSILLLTFTRKASQEMLHRASLLLGQEGASVHGAMGGTFHSFAFQVLRRDPLPAFAKGFSILDRSDGESLIRQAKSDLGLGKGDRSFPKARTVLELLSKARNKERGLEDIVNEDSFHLLPYAEDFLKMGQAFEQLKLRHGLLDYDDLLFHLEELLISNPEVRRRLAERYRYLMVDEYQDTNLIQARLVKLLAGERANVMAVGDDAQSIYAFRGADVRNILEFPQTFANTKIIKLEQNYRSTQPILDLTNRILSGSPAHFEKQLFTTRGNGSLPQLFKPHSDRSQAKLVTDKVVELLKTREPEEVAVLFRAGYQSFQVETALNRLGIRYVKYGGIRFSEAAHVKDVLALLRLAGNPADLPAWQRAVAHVKGVGKQTAAKLFQALMGGDAAYLDKSRAKWPALDGLLKTLDGLRQGPKSPAPLLEQAMDFYVPLMESIYPDDHPRRKKELEELVLIAEGFADMDVFLANVSLEPPDNASGAKGAEMSGAVTLSTVHSAKGLEWSAVLIIDLVEDRFPSRHALTKDESYEEERRLLYVACTRARDYLGLFVPLSLFRRGQEATEPTRPSPFLSDLSPSMYEELREGFGGGPARPVSAASFRSSLPRPSVFPNPEIETEEPETAEESNKSRPNPSDLRHCHHSIFGRGKIVEILSPEKYRVHFPGFGLKVILADYLRLED